MRPIDKPLEEVKNEIFEMAKLTEEIIENLVNSKGSLSSARSLAEKVKERRLEIHDRIVEILARYQPTASDLREVISALEVSYGFFRLSRYALDILTVIDRTKEYVNRTCEFKYSQKIFKHVIDMTFMSIDAFLKRDKGRAKEIIEMDKVVDQDFFEALSNIAKSTEICSVLDLLILVYLERIADHCVYIAREIIELL